MSTINPISVGKAISEMLKTLAEADAERNENYARGLEKTGQTDGTGYKTLDGIDIFGNPKTADK